MDTVNVGWHLIRIEGANCAFPACTTTPNPGAWPDEPPHCVDHCTVHATLTPDTDCVYIPLRGPFTQETNPT